MVTQAAWWAFSVSDDDDDITAIFTKRFGYPPQRIIQRGPVKLAGPIHGSAPVEPGRLVVVGESKDAGRTSH